MTIASSYAVEAGAQVRYYPLGSFIHGMQVGMEVMYLFMDSWGDRHGLGVGPFVGYKIAADIGFTFEVQLGFMYAPITGAVELSGYQDCADDCQLGPLLNMNIGYSL